MRALFLLFFLAVAGTGFAQPKTPPAPPRKPVVQFSGVVVDADSLQPVPFTAVIIQNTHRGTFADVSGYFSFVAQPGDTIQFTTLGYKDNSFVIPDTLKQTRYSLIQLMKRDTYELREAVIYPWPTKEQFKDAFLKLDIPDDDLARAQKNLDQQAMLIGVASIGADGSSNFRSGMQQQSNKMYYAGQLPPNNLLNPVAWSRFVKAWRSGALKKQ
ncbi:MAG: hypothetical protein FD123_3327 [Bacteroidetes bacterium]|nr:MAG: hypothetical protein FD123_3327 [Bacteroidota bacterium]